MGAEQAPELRQWPAEPLPGHPVRLPLALPPMLIEALGYDREQQLVCAWWQGGAEPVRLSDGQTTPVAWEPAYRLLVLEHRLSAALLSVYDLGCERARPARHQLLCDSGRQELVVACPADAELLERQARAAAPLPRARRARRSCELRRLAPVLEAVLSDLERRNYLLRQLQAWLDANERRIASAA